MYSFMLSVENPIQKNIYISFQRRHSTGNFGNKRKNDRVNNVTRTVCIFSFFLFFFLILPRRQM